MALKKIVRKENGIQVCYHRIAMIKIDINQLITVLVASYIDEDGRNYEKDYERGEIVGEPTFPYTDYEYINIDWPEFESGNFLQGNIIEKAYVWLKRQPGYAGSEDV